MRRVLIIKPDVALPLCVYVMILIGMVVAVGSCVTLVMGWSSLCEVLPFMSVGVALVALLPWHLRNVPLGRFKGRRTAFILVALAVFLAVEASWCRLHG
jgi:hypothetical protein